MIQAYLTAGIMGLVEGLTEFLPISSTGHLILAGELLKFDDEVAKTFDVFIQLGAILAVLLVYWRTFLGLLQKPADKGFHGPNGIVLLLLTTLPGLVAGVLAHGFIKAHLFTSFTVAIGLAVGAVWILLAERLPHSTAPRELDRMTWKMALGIGLLQGLALWPGMSRSTCTILGGLWLGLSRKAATEYSFFAAVPLLAAACAYDLLHNIKLLDASTIPLFAIGFVVAFVSAWFAIRFLIQFVAHHTLAVFGWYRLFVAALVLWLM
jgi:undecaprenyl-diphosphatase